MIAVNTSPLHLSIARKANVWFSTNSGNWTDPATWISNGRKKCTYPQSGDTVYIGLDHIVTVNAANLSVTNIYITGTLTYSGGLTFIVRGDLQVTGTLNQSTGSNTLILLGLNNFIVNHIPGVLSAIEYGRAGDQDILDLAYAKLGISGSGNKYMYTPLTTMGDLYVMGTAVLFNLKYTSKITIGGMITNVGAITKAAGIDNTINADIELRGGLFTDMRYFTYNLGTGNLYLNGPNVQLAFAGGQYTNPYINTNVITIKGASVVTVNSNSNTPFQINGSINGDNVSSTLRIAGIIFQGTNVEPMSSMGVYIPVYASTSIIGYVFNGNYTLPYTSYGGLAIQGNGTKTLAGNTVLNTTLAITLGGILELSIYDFTVTGATNLNGPGSVLRTGTGYTTFIGKLTNLGSGCQLKFNTSGSIVEFRNGYDADQRTYAVSGFNWAAGVLIKFSTNNQQFQNGPGTTTIDADVLISGAITVTSVGNNIIMNGTLNGDNASSKWQMLQNNINNGATYKNTQQPMQTGILDCNASPNLWVYGASSNQDITPGTYRSLTLNGSGIKKLLGNVSVVNTYTLTSPATLNSNSFALTNP